MGDFLMAIGKQRKCQRIGKDRWKKHSEILLAVDNTLKNTEVSDTAQDSPIRRQGGPYNEQITHGNENSGRSEEDRHNNNRLEIIFFY